MSKYCIISENLPFHVRSVRHKTVNFTFTSRAKRLREGRPCRHYTIRTLTHSHDNICRGPCGPHSRIHTLRRLCRAGLRRRPRTQDPLLHPRRRRRLHPHADMEGLPHTVPQHRRHGPHLRFDNGHPVRPGGISVDRLWLDLRRRGARLPLGHDIHTSATSSAAACGRPCASSRWC